MNGPHAWCYHLAARLSAALENGSDEELAALRDHLASLSTAQLQSLKKAPRMGLLSPQEEYEAFLLLVDELPGIGESAGEKLPPYVRPRPGQILQATAAATHFEQETTTRTGELRWIAARTGAARFALLHTPNGNRLRVYLQSTTETEFLAHYQFCVDGVARIDSLQFTRVGPEDAYLDLELKQLELDLEEFHGWELVSGPATLSFADVEKATD